MREFEKSRPLTPALCDVGAVRQIELPRYSRDDGEVVVGAGRGASRRS